MINENQLLQLFCIQQSTTDKMIQEYISTVGVSLDNKRPEVREAITRQLLNYCELFLNKRDKELAKAFRGQYLFRSMFKKC